MLRKVLAGVGSIIFLLSFNVVRATELEMRPYLWTEDFEEVDPVKFWTGAKHTINFKGLTEEKSFSGRKSFKLDVTFEEGSHFYWNIRIPRVPAEGRLNFSGRIFLGEETTGTAGLGVNVFFPPTDHSGYDWHEAKEARWRLIEKDLVKHGKNIAEIVMPRHTWGVKAENVGVYVDRIGFFLYGMSGERVVVYLDDFKVEGEVPTAETFREEVERRWAPAKERFAEKISSWEKILVEREEEIALLTDLSEAAEKMKREVEEKLSSLKERVGTIKRRGWINLAEQKEIDLFLKPLKGIISNIKLISEGRIKTEDMLVHVVSPISSHKILPFDLVIPGEISTEIRIIATPGEYEPASFVVFALADLDSLLAEVTDLYLRGGEDIIPSENIEINIVKRWFQAGTAWVCINQCPRRVLVPELLLNDPGLVRVDHERQENYLRLSFPEGERYVWISDPEKTRERYTILSIEDFPVKDSPVLLPVDISKGMNQQFWITVKVPDNAKAGIYTGSINLSTGEETLATLTLKLKVLPFQLSSPKTNHNLSQPFTSSVYYNPTLSHDWPEGSISSQFRSKEQLRAELKNMYSHGIINPTVRQEFDKELLGEYLKIREEVGIGGQSFFYLYPWAMPSLSVVKGVLEVAKAFGIAGVYFYGEDEARGEYLKVQRPYWEAIRKAGGRMFVAGYKDSNFLLMGDIQDLQISAFAPCREEAALWHSVGHRIFSYANPQAGVENPEVFRRNFGLLLWKANFDGAMTFAYQLGFGNIWNDFDHPQFRDHNFTYPTVDGVITTIALAGYREGVDDIRYATTLRLAIEEAKKSGDREIKKVAIEAERHLAELDVRRCLDTIRLEIISYILKLK